MNTKKQHNIDATTQNLASLDAETSVNATRRNFTKSSLIASGVLLTLASRTALGGNLVCKSPSGFLSGNVSTHGTPTKCVGLTPGYWGTHPAQWPLPYQPGKCENEKNKSCSNSASWEDGTRFRNVFNCQGNGSIYSKYSLMQVIWLTGQNDPFQLGAHIVSALLNARFGNTPVLSETQVVNIFNEWDLKGFYEPTAGVKWYAADIVAYLQSTMA